MARKIRLDQIDDVMSEAVSALVAATTLEWTERVILATPVDTGRLRANWQTSIKSLRVQFLIMSHTQSLFVSV